MRRLGTTVPVVGVLVVVLMSMAVPGALAAGGGKPLFHDRFDDYFPPVADSFVLDVCGVEVETEFHFWGQLIGYADNSFRGHANTEIVSTDPDTGEVLLIERRSETTYTEPEVQIIDEQAGTVTFIYRTTFRGMPFKWQVPGEGVLILDAGTVTLNQTVVTDLATQELISLDTSYSDMHGPHPSLAQSDSESLEMFCGAMEA